jgi:hypothetical protein
MAGQLARDPLTLRAPALSISAASDLEARYNHHWKTLKLSATVFPELAELLERERPAEAGRSKSFIAGAGFEPATSGL